MPRAACLARDRGPLGVNGRDREPWREGQPYPRKPTIRKVKSIVSGVPIADIRLTFLTTAVEPSQSSSLGDGSRPLAAIRAVAACTSHTRAFTDFAYSIM